MLQTLVIYIGVMSTMIVCSKYTLKYKIDKDFCSFFFSPIFFSILLFTVIFGMRYNVGIDFPTYYENYRMASSAIIIRDDFEPGFMLITNYMAKLNIHSSIYFSLFVFIQIFFVYFAFKKDKYIYPFLSFMIMLGTFLGWMNLIRQATVICILVWLVSTIKERSFISYSIIIFLCSYFLHKSALILITLYPFFRNRKDYTGSIFFQIVVLFFMLILNTTQLVYQYLSHIDLFIGVLGYTDRFGGRDLVNEFMADYSWGGRTLISLLIVFITILYSNKMKSFWRGTSFISFYNMFYWGTCLHYLFTGVHIFQRMVAYFYFMNYIVYAFLLYYLWIRYKWKKLSIYHYTLYLSIHIISFGGILYSVNDSEAYIKYLFFWQSS